MQKLREDVRPPGGRPALAGLLHGMQGEALPGADHKDVREMREHIHDPVHRQALAEILSKMQAGALGMAEAMIP